MYVRVWVSVVDLVVDAVAHCPQFRRDRRQSGRTGPHSARLQAGHQKQKSGAGVVRHSRDCGLGKIILFSYWPNALPLAPPTKNKALKEPNKKINHHHYHHLFVPPEHIECNIQRNGMQWNRTARHDVQ